MLQLLSLASYVLGGQLLIEVFHMCDPSNDLSI